MSTETFPASKPLRDGRGAHLYRHGMRRTSEYKIWCKIIERCHNPKAINYPRYGGRGIMVCPEWRASFVAFYKHVGPRPSPKHSIERKDNLAGYEPGNVKWATLVEQGRNRRNNVLIEYRGRTQCVVAWCSELGLDYNLTRQRFYRDKWPAERAFAKAQTP